MSNSKRNPEKNTSPQLCVNCGSPFNHLDNIMFHHRRIPHSGGVEEDGEDGFGLTFQGRDPETGAEWECSVQWGVSGDVLDVFVICDGQELVNSERLKAEGRLFVTPLKRIAVTKLMRATEKVITKSGVPPLKQK